MNRLFCQRHDFIFILLSFVFIQLSFVNKLILSLVPMQFLSNTFPALYRCQKKQNNRESFIKMHQKITISPYIK